jgi:hypothetical protein
MLRPRALRWPIGVFENRTAKQQRNAERRDQHQQQQRGESIAAADVVSGRHRRRA